MKAMTTPIWIEESASYRRCVIVVAAMFLVLCAAGVGLGGVSASAQEPAAWTSSKKSLRTFEDLHTERLGLNCQACHDSRQASDYLRIEAGVFEVAPTNDSVIVNREACLTCHAPSVSIFGDQMLKAGEAYRK
jgi:hypothetical protein